MPTPGACPLKTRTSNRNVPWWNEKLNKLKEKKQEEIQQCKNQKAKT